MTTHREPALKNNAIEWARYVLENKEQFVILDTETTGLENHDVIVQIALIDIDGNTLFNSLIKPTKKRTIPSEASAIHGIKIGDLKMSPSFAEIVEDIYHIVKNKTVIIYNEAFDIRLIRQTCIADDVKILTFDSICIMTLYSEFVGAWSEYHQNYRYQRLIGGDHTALSDCLAVLKRIKVMANTDLLPDSQKKMFNPKRTVVKTSTIDNDSTYHVGCFFWIFGVAILLTILFLYLIF
jgi:DNA polymerase III subunit epsilon